jgi:S-adenosylmethionine:diacylglycerol 3-amino-3-carboxypropyl transferase
MFFRKSLFPGALPEYLKPENHEAFLQRQHHISFVPSSMENMLAQALPGQFNKVLLSNIGDWMSREEMAKLFTQIQEKTNPGSRMVLRYIYLDHPVPESASFLKPDHGFGMELIKTDRFPFSSIVPINILK